MSNKAHRVAVAFTDVSRKSAIYADSRFDSDVKILDNHALLLRLNNNQQTRKVGSLPARYFRHLEFDAVGYEYEPHMVSETTDLLDEMFRTKQNSSFVRFIVPRINNLNLLRRILVADVDKIMTSMRCRIKSITLEYYDVRKFDMVNMLAEGASRARSPSMRRTLQAITSRTMQSTRELFQWLVTEYSALRGRSIGDDFIDVEFVYSDCNLRLHQVHLALFQVFGCDTRTDVASLFETLASGKNLNRTLLTDCIKECFDFKRPLRALLLFEMPLNRERDCPEWMRKMLRLADSAYTNISKALDMCSDVVIAAPKQSLLSVCKTGRSASSDPVRPVSQLKSRMISQYKPVAPTIAELPPATSTYDLERWYKEIDNKVSEVRHSMDKFYMAMYENKSLQMCNQLRYAEGGQDEDNECHGDSQSVHSKASHEADARDQYNEDLANFRRLESEVEHSCFASTLKVYVAKKSYELAKAEKELKQREIDNLRLNVISCIKMETL
ncbi:uncharacterized protein LOC115621772 [Scaptodrosophila lebanonensis]|uniref:Uncharacterized protein LOC115621772 n=1 Tax=Drosophila lebanonensis TaxID=7225 RepID=A0A6J2T5S9_DROLE|nr:uncharacterized protein LOC115621772 [Scaptodrosophila lebanonensis]